MSKKQKRPTSDELAKEEERRVAADEAFRKKITGEYTRCSELGTALVEYFKTQSSAAVDEWGSVQANRAEFTRELLVRHDEIECIPGFARGGVYAIVYSRWQKHLASWRRGDPSSVPEDAPHPPTLEELCLRAKEGS